MSKYLVLYVSGVSAADQLSGATAEQQQAGMDAWMAWMQKAGDAIVDLGAPLQDNEVSDNQVGGYSILQADTQEALDDLLRDHPHRSVGDIRTYEFVEMPTA